MKVTIFGATGRTGRHLVRQALDAGYDVVAFARTPSKLETIQHERLTVVQGDVVDVEAVKRAVSGTDVVLSALGPTKGASFGVMRLGLDNILTAMGVQNVRRLVVVVGAGVGDPQDHPRLFDRVVSGLLKLIAKDFYVEMKGVASTVRASDLDWTLVRVPMLTDNPATGNIRVDYLGGDVGSRLSREDLAQFMLAQVANAAYVQKSPVVSS